MNCEYNRLYDTIENNWYKTIFEITGEIIEASYQFYKDNNIKPVLMPITSGAVSSPMGLGSDSLPVKIKLFDIDTYLADSMQFQLEYMLRQGGCGVWYIMPTFRGEEPDETHLNQFFHSEVEIIGGLNEIINLAGKYVHAITNNIYNNKKENLLQSNIDLKHIEHLLSLNGIFPSISYKDAIDLLGLKHNYFKEIDKNVYTITRNGEKKLIEHFGGVVWLTNSHYKTVPFYQAREGDCAKNADLLFGVGEVLGCGERNTTSQEVLSSIGDHNVDAQEYLWYIKMKDKYPMLTSGFGMGIERYLLWLLKHGDIRDTHLMSRLKGEKVLF